MAQVRSLRSVPPMLAVAFVLASCSSTRIDPLEFDYYSSDRDVQPAAYASNPGFTSAPVRSETAPIVPIGGAAAAPIPAAAAATTVTVRKGDSLYALSREHLGSGNRWREIAKLNGLSERDATRLSVGRVLKLPAR